MRIATIYQPVWLVRMVGELTFQLRSAAVQGKSSAVVPLSLQFFTIMAAAGRTIADRTRKKNNDDLYIRALSGRPKRNETNARIELQANAATRTLEQESTAD